MASRRASPNGSLEREIIAALAAADGPLSAGEVKDQLAGDRSYSTVVTTLSRLFDKQALTRQSRGRGYVYELAGNSTDAQASITAHQMRRLLNSGADQASVLTRFVSALDPEAERLLRSLLGDQDQAGS